MATAGSISSSCKGLNEDQLKEWLLETLGDKFKADIEKLAEASIDGKLFLTLTTKDLDDLKVSPGFRIRYRRINTQSDNEETDGAAVNIPEAKKPRIQPPTLKNNFFFCMTGYKHLPAKAQVTASASAAGAIPFIDGKPAVWSGYKELRVKFLYDNGVNPANYAEYEIIKVANTWNDLESSIPRFRLATENESAEIRVKLNVKGRRHSCIGIEAKSITDQSKATMELDIHTGVTADMNGTKYKRHLVMHEFGHALGLCHEHQRSDFWANIKDFIDIKTMKATIRARLGEISTPEFETYWKNQWAEAPTQVVGETDYDRHSIMHYWFLKEWFDWNKYKANHHDLNTEIVTTMDAIENCMIMLADEPSKRDLELLRDFYGAKDKRREVTGPPVPDSGGQQSPLDPSQLRNVFNEVREARVQWYQIGLELGVAPDNLDVANRRHRSDPDDCMREVLQIFLRGKDLDSNAWIQLAKALESPAVGHAYLGDRIRNKY